MNNKINYKFKKNPNLKYRLDITNDNLCLGVNDTFEVFLAYKDNKEYLISPNNYYNLDVFILADNKKALSLKGHQTYIETIRYFINNKNFNEYLISGDKSIIIIWDISDNYNIKYQIDTKYNYKISSCLIIFPYYTSDNFIVTSTEKESNFIYKSASKIYSLNSGNYIRYISNTDNVPIYHLLSWYNKKSNKYYIIQFSIEKIIINNLLEDELYSELKTFPKIKYFHGFIYNENSNDYLCTSTSVEFILIWDLFNKKIFKIINTNKCIINHIIQWNDKYIIVVDLFSQLIKIIDLGINNIISSLGKNHERLVLSVKKIYHPIYGESLLSSSLDRTIKLWTI